MKCLYCQNSPWSWRGGGADKTVAELTEIFRGLALVDRVENWNLVSPTPYLPSIREALKPLRDEGVSLPAVWNSSGYERVETLEEYSDLCDWALFDLRYSRDETARFASAAPDYVACSRAAVAWAWRRLGAHAIVRLLVLPGHSEEAVENLAWLATELSTEIPVSLMCQYTPSHAALRVPPFNRGVTEEEYAAVVEAAADFGFENGWTQGFGAADPASALHGENMPPDHGTVR
ncbi:MAG: radical SAM protein [Kiritimatiellae bacterium]|nr:radical SAM protein [Kiritimatiellia bacterium]